MADVRLTATNPADSSVVPVACNEKGELKLEEIPDQSFDGNLDGDLTVYGSASIGGTLDVYNQFSVNSLDPNVAVLSGNLNGVQTTYISASGSASFAEVHSKYVEGGDLSNENGTAYGVVAYSNAANVSIQASVNALNAHPNGAVWTGRGPDFSNTPTSKIMGNGAATFAGNKAGFTAEGYLWCTTPRGDTVMLTATVGGAGMWEEYNPPTRRDEIEQWAEKNGIRPMPEESSQDEPETTQ